MNVFPYELALCPQVVAKENLEFSLDGVARALAPSAETDAGGGIAEPAKLGFRLFGDEDMSLVIFEDRARLNAGLDGARRESGFSLHLKWNDASTRRMYLLMSFLYEGKYWFFERDIAAKYFVLERQGRQISCAAKPDAPRQTGSALGEKGAGEPTPDTAAWCSRRELGGSDAFARQIEAVSQRFGLRVALTFGYHYALGRPPDPLGLNEKLREIVSGRMTIGDTCRILLESDEFKQRNLDLLPHPARVIGPWARLGEASQARASVV
jgi:hypothetical protein